MAFVEVGPAGEVPAEAGKQFEVEGKSVAVFRTGGCLRAVAAVCPHQGGPLAEGSVKDGVATCPWHRWSFDLGTGACKTRPSVTLPTYAVKEEGGKLLVDVQAPAGPAVPAPAAAPAAAEAKKKERPAPREVASGTGFKYAARVRNDAVQHLLGFLGKSTEHLEPKTKFLIYVALQTVTFSERGLKQYIPKAIEAGASEDEVIDAIMAAYPGAGLAKVVDALDVFLGLGYGGELKS